MPTKPATTYTFATDALFGSGPAVGLPTKIVPGSLSQGFIPGNGINSEWVNYLFDLTGTWITDWIALGTSSADLDAHVVETDADGKAAIAALALGFTASADEPLRVSSNSSFATYAARISSFGSGFGLLAESGSSDAAILADNSGTGPGVEAAAAAGDGGVFTGGGSGRGLDAEGGATGGGGRFTGNGAAHGLEAYATGTGSALVAERQVGGGPAGRFEIAGAGTVQRGTLWLEPQNAPAVDVDGDIWKQTGFAGFGRGGLEWTDDDGAPGGGAAGKQRAWSTSAGLGFEFDEDLGDTTESAGVNVTKVSLGLDSAGSPGHPQGQYWIDFKASVRLGGGAATTTRAIIDVFGPGGLIESHTQEFETLGDDCIFSTFIQVTLGAGIQTYSIRFRTNTPGDDVIMSKARIRALGAFE